MKYKVMFFLFLLATPGVLFAYQPFHSTVYLVAGEGSAGFGDGLFSEARFDGITSILYDQGKDILYVADENNKAIRLVHLSEEQRVSTLIKNDASLDEKTSLLGSPFRMAFSPGQTGIFITDRIHHQVRQLDIETKKVVKVWGTGQAGFKNGKENECQFKNPAGIVCLGKSGLLLVADKGNAAIRVIDLGSGKTGTLCASGELAGIDNIVTDEKEQSLLFSLESKPNIWTLASADKQVLRLSPEMPSSFFSDQPKDNWGTVPYAETVSFPISGCRYGSRLLVCLQLPSFRSQSPLLQLDLNNPQSKMEINLHEWLPITSNEIYKLQIDKNAEMPAQKHRLFDWASGFAMDAKRGVIYAADQANGRILGFKIPDGMFPEIKNEACDPNIDRILLYGSSMVYKVADTSDSRLDNAAAPYACFAFYRRLEYWLNFLSFIRGNVSKQFEVVFAGTDANFGTGSISYTLSKLETDIKTYQPKLIILNFSVFDTIYDAFEYLYKPPENGTIKNTPDWEFLTQDIRKRDLHPLGRKLLALLDSHTAGKLDYFAGISNGQIAFNENTISYALEREKDRQVLFELFGSRLQTLAEKIRGVKGKLNKPDLIISQIPVPSDLSRAEGLSARSGGSRHYNYLKPFFETWCAQHGVGYFDNVTGARILEPSFFPMFICPGDDHYSKKGADLVAFMTAWQLLEQYYNFKKSASAAAPADTNTMLSAKLPQP